MGDAGIDILRSAEGHFLGGCATVDRRVDGPQGRMVVRAFQSHEILILSPVTTMFQPQLLIHGLQGLLSLLLVVSGILAQYLGDAGCQSETPIVIGRRVGDGSTVIIEGITGPDAAVGIIEPVVIRVIVAFLPVEMALQHGPHPAHIDRIGIILEVPQQFVDIVQVHVIVVHDVTTVGIAADIAIGVHLRAPGLGGTSQSLFRILRRMRNHRLHIRHLTVGIGREMRDGTVGHTEHIAEEACPPPIECHAPDDSAMQPHLSIPCTVGSSHQRSTKCVNIGVGGVEDNLTGQPVMVFHGLIEELLGSSPVGNIDRIRASSIDSHQRVCRPCAHCPSDRLFVSLFWSRVEAVSWICVHVTPAMKRFYLDIAHHALQSRIYREPVSLKCPDTGLSVGHGQSSYRQGALTEGRISQPIGAHTGIVAGLALSRVLQLNGRSIHMQAETDIPMVLSPIGAEDGTVARLYPEVGISAVECTGIAVSAVHTHDITPVRVILQSSWFGSCLCREWHQDGCCNN